MANETIDATVTATEEEIKKLTGKSDRTAAVSFSLITGIPYELFWLGMTGKECLKSRAVMTLFNLATGKKFGQWSDWIYKKFGVKKNEITAKRFVADLASCISFYTPAYTALIYAITQDAEKTQNTAYTSAVYGAIIGFPYRWYIDLVRGRFGVPKQENEQSLEQTVKQVPRAIVDASSATVLEERK